MPQIKCNNCINGWVLVNERKICGRCLGSGEDPSGGLCLTCKGKCYIMTQHREACRNCHGTGKVSF